LMKMKPSPTKVGEGFFSFLDRVCFHP